MYARTKFDILTIIGERDNEYEIKNGTTINRYINYYIDKSDVIKLSDKVEDLCDEFIIVNKNNTFIWRGITDFEFAKDNCDFKDGEKIIGIINKYDGVKVKVAETDYSYKLHPINSTIYKED